MSGDLPGIEEQRDARVIPFPNAAEHVPSVEPLLEALAQRVARLVAHLVPARDRSPWLSKDEAIEYTRLPRGTFEKLAADGRIPSHGGKTKVFNRAELDRALEAL